MPIYEYRCRKCEKEFEIFVASMNAHVQCESCSSEDLQRKFSVFGMKTSGKARSSSSHGCSGGCGNCSSGCCGNCSCGH